MHSEPRNSERASYCTAVKTPSSRPQSSPQTKSRSRSGSFSSSPHVQQTNSLSFSTNESALPMASPPRVSSPGSTQHFTCRPSSNTLRTPATKDVDGNSYFGLAVESISDARDSADMPRENWSPATSSVKSFGAAIPKQIPLDANPDFEAFRRQIDVNRVRAHFSLSGTNTPAVQSPAMLSPLVPPRSRPPRCSSDYVSQRHLSVMHARITREASALKTNSNGSACVDSDRSSDGLPNPPSVLDQERQESPAQIESPYRMPEQLRCQLSRVDDRHPRLSLVQEKVNPPTPGQRPPRADSVPWPLDATGPVMMPPALLKDVIESAQTHSLLLLDLRVSPQFAQSRIKGALNLCIPTTLLKRATFNLQKLEQTFQSDGDRERFSTWRETSHVVVYDAFSSEKRDAMSAINMLKKFTNEGYSGVTAIVRGGFKGFAAAYPALIDSTAVGLGLPSSSLTGSGNSEAGASRPGPLVAPVIGGVVLPTFSDIANPFFSNIRQNQDLVDGVGQMDIKVPAGLDTADLPLWLREAAAGADHGKKVSDRFLRVELAEQARMREAYSVGKANTSSGDKDHVQLSGLEKGGKNRYKDILPFEHTRVRLHGRPDDYVNASHIQASGSRKRYIASQGPLPATFEDFWSVIWDHDVRVIVMLTAESEGGQLKCHPYWQSREFGPYKLRALSEKKVSLEIDKHMSNTNAPSQSSPTAQSTASNNGFCWNASASDTSRRRSSAATAVVAAPAPSPAQHAQHDTPFVMVRKFALSHASQPFAPIREITQLHYTSWPDFGAPAQPSNLLALVELANVMQRAASPVKVQDGFTSGSPSSNQTNGVSAGGNTSTRWASDVTSPSWQELPEFDENSRPMLVHCSAGCGRTGTFCTVDSVVDMLKRKRLLGRTGRGSAEQTWRAVPHAFKVSKGRDADGDVAMAGSSLHEEDVSPRAPAGLHSLFSEQGQTRDISVFRGNMGVRDDDAEEAAVDHLGTGWLRDENVDLIARTVEDFRGQRLSMVQSLRQFVLCYETITEWIWRLRERGAGHGVDGNLRTRTGNVAN